MKRSTKYLRQRETLINEANKSLFRSDNVDSIFVRTCVVLADPATSDAVNNYRYTQILYLCQQRKTRYDSESLNMRSRVG